MKASLEQLRRLPPSEKLRIIVALWDDLCRDDGAPCIQAWQRDETRRRAASHQIALTRDEMWHSVDRSS